MNDVLLYILGFLGLYTGLLGILEIRLSNKLALFYMIFQSIVSLIIITCETWKFISWVGAIK